jgi:hypothetical protein
MELAQHLLDLQGMTDFLSVDTTPIGNGIGFVVVSFTGGKEKFRKAIFESSDDARHFIAEIRDASLRNERHWFMNPHPYMASHRSLKSLSKKESSHD